MCVIVSHVVTNEVVFDCDLLVGLATIGMPLFFTLSGFLMCHNYYADFATRRPGTLSRFYLSRFVRIYPAYIVALLLSFSFMGNFFHDLQNHPSDTAKCLGLAGTLTQSWVFLPVFTETHNPRTVAQAYLGVAWSISTEMFFYATFPLIIPLLKRLARPLHLVSAMAVIWSVGAAFDLWLLRDVTDFWGTLSKNSRDLWLLNYSPYVRIGEFWMGCLAGRLFDVLRFRIPGASEARGGAIVTLLCPLALVGYTALVGHNDWITRLHLNVGEAPACVLLIFCLARYSSCLQRLLACRAFTRLGESSYSLFLLHPLVQSFYLPRTHGEDEMNLWYIVGYNHLMMILVLHCLAIGFHRLVESPLRAKARHWTIGQRVGLQRPARTAIRGNRAA